MRSRTWLVGVTLFVAGVIAGVLWPPLKAQAAPDPCVAAWEVVTGVERDASGTGRSGWHAVKWNRCTGEAVVFSTNDHKLEDKSAWLKLPAR